VIQQNADVTFGPRLKAHRERRGITLEALAASTKIKRSLLAELEQNSIAHWPEGIYRRAWLREYATTIGMPPEQVLEEFSRLFPEPGETNAFRSDADTPALRLTFGDVRRRAPVTRSRVVDALGVLIVVLACGGTLGVLSGLTFWSASGVVALIWYPVASAVYGGASWRGLLQRWAQFRSNAPAPTPSASTLLRTANSVSRGHSVVSPTHR